ncbi:SPOR domain-containing protein [Cellulophaga sp. F20128]|uniref:SPOR domain-containing protein n=1 Tax=Cellulophaga sp. F20128 TaxID=2926413 RepID=UPI001FF1B9FE|nr:SPOR domain-containing protein [Cellulophaga sp. F20128]MCK0155586.1 SPOR domain-containing protein [Cellulophaga sp. F20128]
MKTLYYTLLFLCFTAITQAQEGKITIKQDKEIETLLDLYVDNNKTTKHYYTIQIHSSKASQSAQNAKEKAATDFPGWPSTLDFIHEYYKVTIGKFKTKFEAQQKYVVVLKKYPNAQLLNPQ